MIWEFVKPHYRWSWDFSVWALTDVYFHDNFGFRRIVRPRVKR